MEPMLSRRAFTAGAISSLTTFSLLETLLGTEAYGAGVRPIVRHWLADLDRLARDVRDQNLKQVEWQKKVEELFSKIDLPDFLKLIDFETVAKRSEGFTGRGEQSLSVSFPKVDGIPTSFVFGRQIFACKKGRSVVPHGHDNMATAFLVLKGAFRGRQYDRTKDEPGHMILRSTVDREFAAGGVSTISDYKDNVHWFEATADAAFIFNIHVTNVNPGLGRSPKRIYVDPNGEKIDGGLIRGRLISGSEAVKLYG